MTRTIIFFAAFLVSGCGKSACDELADCLGVDVDSLEQEDDDACQTALDALDGACGEEGGEEEGGDEE